MSTSPVRLDSPRTQQTYNDSAEPHFDPDTPPFPISPALNPASPRNLSNVSSLIGSRELGRAAMDPSSPFAPFRFRAQQEVSPASSPQNQCPFPIGVKDEEYSGTSSGELDLHTETQALMQMLSLVGSTFFEADKEGFAEDEDEVEEPMLFDPQQDTFTAQPDAATQPKRDRVWALLKDDLTEDSSTPRGGQTPLATSLLAAVPPRSQKALAKQFGSQSDILVPRHGVKAKRSGPPLTPTEIQTSPRAAEEDDADKSTEGIVKTHPQDGQGSARLDSSGTDVQLGQRSPSRRVDRREDFSLSSELPLLQPFSTTSTTNPEGSAAANRDRLADQLKRTFDLDASESLVIAQPCWLFRSLLLQGHLYLTTSHLCFYAYLPSRDDKTMKTGPLGKRTRRTHRFSKHWASLRGGILSWFDSDKDPYFPQGHIDLRKVSAIEPSSKHHDRFKVTTPARRFTFLAESQASRDAWMATLRKETFRAQNEGESVRISIPLEAILNIETTLSVDSTEMVCISVIDETSDFSVDEYFFLHLSRPEEFMQIAKDLISEAGRGSFGGSTGAESSLGLSKLSIKDSTGGVQASGGTSASLNTVPSLPASQNFTAPSPINQGTVPDSQGREASMGTIVSDVSTSTEARSPTKSAGISIPSRKPRLSQDGQPTSVLSTTPRAALLNRRSMESDHTYPPSPSSVEPPKSFSQIQKEADRGWAVPEWIKSAPSKVLGRTSTAETLAGLVGGTSHGSSPSRRKIMESWPKDRDSDAFYDGSAAEQEDDPMSQSTLSVFSVLDAPDESESASEEALFTEQFRETFGLADDESLIGHMHAHLYRVLPVAGRFFVSTSHLAFRSSGVAAKTVGRTLMVVPLEDVVSAAKHQAFRFGQHGLVITIKGHEELFVEVSSSNRRDELLSLIDHQLELIRKGKVRSGPDEVVARERSNALVLRDLSEKIDSGLETASADSSMLSGKGSEYGRSSSASQSEGSAMLSFTPTDPLFFTMLTIGSRGDVQPYIALAKGLQAEGHRVRIATHGEFGDWIKGHGIEFSEIGGDPAELMRICVENGTFTVSFLREGVTKFRDWLDDLLASSWKACQGSDVVIECPSAIAGIHVAEALQVPYFRAFTMPWTRTRAYPHAFAVPNKKAGGNYNYMSYVIFDQMFWRASAYQINRWRKRMLNLQATNLEKLEQHKVPFIYNFSPSLVPRPLDWFEWIHVTGFWFLDNPDNSSSKKWQPPADLVDFIRRAKDKGRKLVYIGWGSIVVSDADAVTRCVLQAVQKSGVCAIISKGWSDRLSSAKSSATLAVDPSVMEDVFQVSSVPHDWLFPQIDAACHHGGAGTLGASLRAGLPTVIKPYFGDQFFWGQQVESLGVGSCVRKLTADNLASALIMATTNAKQIERAKKLGEQIRSEDGIGNAIKAIYRDLDYARSRIKRNSRFAPQPESNADLLSRLRSVAGGEGAVHRMEGNEATELESTNLSVPPSISEAVDEDSQDGHTSDEWSDIGGGPWSPGMSSQGEPSNSIILNATAT